MSEFIERQVVDYKLCELPFDKEHYNVKLLDASKVRLCFSHKVNPVDFGCIAYSNSKTKNRKRSESHIKLVEHHSLRKERLILLENLLESVFVSYKMNQLREITIDQLLYKGFKFFKWCDTNGKQNFCNSFELVQASLRSYIEQLRHEVKASIIVINYATSLQNYAIEIIARMFNKHKTEIIKGMRLLAMKNETICRIHPPQEHDVQIILKLCDKLFNGLTDFILNNNKYPFQLELPKNTVWVVPHPQWMATPSDKEHKTAWNYATGTLYKVEDMSHLYNAKTFKDNIKCARRVINRTIKLLERANTNMRDRYRLNLAELAKEAFLLLFLANTGMNFAQFRYLKWDAKFNIGFEQQGFRSIKYRAQGREVEFHISINFLSQFKKYLKLRDFLLNNQTFDYLFFCLGRHFNNLKQIPTGIQFSIFKKMRTIEPNISNITSREWRVNKTNFVLKETGDIELAAMLVQNQPETIIKSYAEGNEADTTIEWGVFFDKLNQKVYKPNAVGNCKDYGNPVKNSNSSQATINPDCRKHEGCLFCSNFAIHADEVDIRKLCSLICVAKSTISLSDSNDHHYKLFSSIYDRVNSILKTISDKSDTLSQLVNTVEIDVEENENLDEFWESQLNMLINIGAI